MLFMCTTLTESCQFVLLFKSFGAISREAFGFGPPTQKKKVHGNQATKVKLQLNLTGVDKETNKNNKIK